MEYDVVVVGGGPAGSSAAYFLARQGVRVLVLDKAKFPRDKVCGDGVAPRAVRALYKMGLEERLDGRFNKFHGFRFAGHGKSVVESPIPPTPGFPDHGYIIRRIDLDALLLDHARENGAEVWEECNVTAPLIEDGRVAGVKAVRENRELEVGASVVIGADGAHSTLGHSMRLLVNDPLYIGVAVRQYFEGVEDIGDHLEVYPERVISPASGWIFPVTETVANVGVGAMLYHMHRDNINLHRYFDSFLTESRYAAPKLRNARPISPLRGALLRVGMGASLIECPGMILVGDAASMINPVSGEGITFALETGDMAAGHVLESLVGPRGIHHDPAENSFRQKLVNRYLHYFTIGTRSIRWGNRPVFMRPLLKVLSGNQARREEAIRALMYLRH